MRFKKPSFKFEFNTDKLKDCGKAAGLAGVTVLSAVAKNSLENFIQAKANEQIYKKATYSGVITAIVNSDMWSSDKEKVVELIPADADPELYGSILAVVMENGMWSSDKLQMIKILIKKVAINTTAVIGKEDCPDE